MANDWSKRFWKPVYPRGGKPIETLAEARAYMLAMPAGAGTRPEWHRAIQATMAAAEGKETTHAARDALTNALFVNAKLDLEHE